MTSIETARIASLYRYPVKGLSPEPLDEVQLTPGETVPYDRAYAIENGQGRFQTENPQHLPKINFLMLMRNERLATLSTQFDPADESLTILRDGKQVARGQLGTAIGRQMLEQFFAAYMKDDLRGAPHIVQAPGHSFSDVAAKCLHIVNLESIRELERAAGQPIDPLRFRANVYLEDLPPWEEFNWIDKSIDLGGAKLKVFGRTDRCAATNVDPKSGARDMAIPAVLERTWGHIDFGVYAKVETGGTIKPGDSLALR